MPMSNPIFSVKPKYEKGDIEEARNRLRQASDGMINNLANCDIIALQEMGIVRCQELAAVYAEKFRVEALLKVPENNIEALDRNVPEEINGYDTSLNKKGIEAINTGLLEANVALNQQKEAVIDAEAEQELVDEALEDIRDEVLMVCIKAVGGRQDPADALLRRLERFAMEEGMNLENEMAKTIVEGIDAAAHTRLLPPPEAGKGK